MFADYLIVIPFIGGVVGLLAGSPMVGLCCFILSSAVATGIVTYDLLNAEE